MASIIRKSILIKEVSSYVDEVITSINKNKTLFFDSSSFYGFSFFYDKYQCCYCGINIVVQSCGASQFMESIIDHIHNCPKEKNFNNISTEEFTTIFNKIVNSGTLIKERILVYLLRERRTKKCVLCEAQNWQISQPCQRITNLVKTLLPSEGSCLLLDCPIGERFQDIKSVAEEMPEIDYVFEFFTILEKHNIFLTTQGRIDAFSPCLTKYLCHQCNQTIDSKSLTPRSFMNVIEVHVTKCLQTVESNGEQESDSNLMKLFESTVADGRAVKENFVIIKKIFPFKSSCCCKHCSTCWQNDHFCKMSPGAVYKILSKHLKNNHPKQTIDVWSIIDSAYLHLKEISESFQCCKPFWKKTTLKGEDCGTLTCSLCLKKPADNCVSQELKFNLYTSSSVIKFKEDILLHHNTFHRAIKNEVYQDIVEFMEVEEDVEIVFNKVKRFDQIVLNSKVFWSLQNESKVLIFNCKFCKCSVDFSDKISRSRIFHFLFHHLRTDGHWSPDPKRQSKLASQPSFLNLDSASETMQSQLSPQSFEDIYKTFDNTDKLINLSKKCFVKQGNKYFCNLCLSHFNIGLDVFEKRWLLWEHIHSMPHKKHFPHVEKDLERLKTNLLTLLSEDLQLQPKSKGLKKLKNKLKEVVVGPGCNLTECKTCGSAVPMRFYAIKNHVSNPCTKQDAFTCKKMDSYLKSHVLKSMKNDLSFIRMGLIPGYVTCSLCACVIMLTPQHLLKLHLAGAQHVQYRGGIWYM